MSRRTKCITIALPDEDHELLEQIAEANDRDPWGQARWMLRQALAQSHVSAQLTDEANKQPSAAAAVA